MRGSSKDRSRIVHAQDSYIAIYKEAVRLIFTSIKCGLVCNGLLIFHAIEDLHVTSSMAALGVSQSREVKGEPWVVPRGVRLRLPHVRGITYYILHTTGYNIDYG